MNVDHYLTQGCGRCKLVGTPECKVHTWQDELRMLRSIVLASGLTEEVKWSAPCYTLNGKNVVMLGAFKDNCVIVFFKGALLQDADGVLEKSGENTQASRVVRFTDLKKVAKLEATLKAYIQEAIEVEKAGLKVPLKKPSELVLPAELLHTFEKLPDFKKAFLALTPGKQRAYVLTINDAKQEATRYSRIEKYIPQIMRGEGIHDAYAKRK